MKKHFYHLRKQVIILGVAVVTALLFTTQAFSQGVAISNNAANTPHVSSILDLSYVTDKGFLTPRVALTGATDLMGNATVKEGLLVYNDGSSYGTAGFYYNASTIPATPNWTSISSTSGTITGTGSAGHVTYWAGASALTYDNNANFFWDETNNVLSIGDNTPENASVLDLNNISNKGVTVPNIGLADALDVTTVTGAPYPTSLLIYNTATAGTTPDNVKPGYYFWNGVRWIAIASILPSPNPATDGTVLLWDPVNQIYANSPVSTSGTTTTITEDVNLAGNDLTADDIAADDVTADQVKTATSLQSSDARFKHNVNTIENALSKVLQLRGVTYEWNTDMFPEKSFRDGVVYGVIAQEVEKVVPELVHTDDDAVGYKSVEYANMVSLFIEAIKEQQAIIDAQKSDIKVLKASIENRNEEMNTLISRITALEKSVENNTNKAEK